MELNFNKLFTRKENISYNRTNVLLDYLNIDKHANSPIGTYRVFNDDGEDKYIYNGIFEFFSIDPLQEKDQSTLVQSNEYAEFNLNLAYTKAMLLDNKNLYINAVSHEHENRFLVYTILWKLLTYEIVIIHHNDTATAHHIKYRVLKAYEKLSQSIKDQIQNIENRINIISKCCLSSSYTRGISSSIFLLSMDTELNNSDNVLTLIQTITTSSKHMKFNFNWMVYSIIPVYGYDLTPKLKDFKDSILPLQLYMLNHKDILDSQDSFYLRFDYNELGMNTNDINNKKIMYCNRDEIICQELYMMDYNRYNNKNS